MLSRVANAIYWMNRYIERAENVARFVDVNLQLMLDLPERTGEQWDPLVDTTADGALFHERYDDPSPANVLQWLTFDTGYANSILSCLTAARENARSVREIISSEMWEQVNKAYLMVKAPLAREKARETPHEFYTEVKMASHLFVGITYITMTHNEAWHFGRLGGLLERADKTSRIVDVKSYLRTPDATDAGSYEEIQWVALLKSVSAFEMYRKHAGRLVPARVVEFLLFNRQFPRSIRHCVNGADDCLHMITGAPPDTAQSTAEKRLGRLRAELGYGDLEEVLALGVHQYLDTFQSRLNAVGDAISETFFTSRPVAGATEAKGTEAKGTEVKGTEAKGTESKDKSAA